jgi:hypothetical protein
MVTELQSEHESISGKVMNLSKNIEKEAQRVDRSGKVCLTRAIEIMNRRALKRGLSKWKETVTI